MLDPTSRLRRRLGAAIDWRVRDAVVAAQPAAGVASMRDIEELSDQVEALRVSVAQISTSLSDELRSLTLLLEQLHRRVAEVEQR